MRPSRAKIYCYRFKKPRVSPNIDYVARHLLNQAKHILFKFSKRTKPKCHSSTRQQVHRTYQCALPEIRRKLHAAHRRYSWLRKKCHYALNGELNKKQRKKYTHVAERIAEDFQDIFNHLEKLRDRLNDTEMWLVKARHRRSTLNSCQSLRILENDPNTVFQFTLPYN